MTWKDCYYFAADAATLEDPYALAADEEEPEEDIDEEDEEDEDDDDEDDDDDDKDEEPKKPGKSKLYRNCCNPHRAASATIAFSDAASFSSGARNFSAR